MDPRRWKEIQAAFDELVELEPAERVRRLATLGAADSDLRDAVEALLAAHAEAGQLLAPINAALRSPASGAARLDHLSAALADRYHIERELGAGGMATVYLAEDLKHRRKVALKVLKPELAAVLGAERFLREIEIAANLNHPHILPVFDSGEAGGLLYYVMPHVEGGSLRQRLEREKQLSIDDAVQIAHEVADALDYAHRHNVVHRDVKPENILLEERHAVVADFGVAGAIDVAGGPRLTETGVALGTPAYMSPEQVAGSKEVDGRSDLYALGCVLYEMLAGEPPFTGPTMESIVHQHLAVAAPSITNLRPAAPAAVAGALARALAKTPADRFSRVSEFAQALGERELAATQAAAAAGARLRRRVARVAAGVGIAVAAAFAALLIGRNGGGNAAAASVVVVMPFENRSADRDLDALGAMAADWVTQGLAVLPFLKVLDTRSALAAAHTLGATVTPVAVGRETGAGVVVTGSYLLQGDSLQFQTQIASTADGSILFGLGGVAAPRDRQLEGVEQLRQRVLAALASLHDEDVTAFQTTLSQLPTYAAYREYTEGLELYMRDEFEEAARKFERAAVLDSSFLVARIWAAQAWTPPRPGNLVAIDSLLDGLEPLRHRLSPFDRARLDFVTALRARDVQDAYRAALRMLEAAPGSIDAQRELGISALRALRPREALTRLEQLNPEHGFIRQWPQYWSPIAWSHHILGEYQQDLAVARRGRELNPSSAHFRFLELRALAALGRRVELDSLVRAELSAVPGQSGILARAIAGELLAHGHGEAARRLAHDAAELLAGRAPSEQAAREWLQQHASLAVFSGDSEVWDHFSLERLWADSPWERANDEWLHQRAELALLLDDVDAAANFAAQLGDPDVHGLLPARVAAAQGRHEAARVALEQAERRHLDRWGNLRGMELAQASVLVRMGDLEGALRVLTEGLALGLIFDGVWGNDGHARPDLAPLWGDARFQALIRPRG
jgi:TolB-like protein